MIKLKNFEEDAATRLTPERRVEIKKEAAQEAQILKDQNMIKLKDFQEYIETRLTPEEIAEIDQQVDLEVKILKSVKQFISSSIEEYMAEHKVGFNEMVDKLGSSPSHLSKIKKGQANLTINSVAHLMAILGKQPQDILLRLKK